MKQRAIGIGALAQSLALTPASHAGFGHGLAMRTFFALVASVVFAGTSGAVYHCPDGSVGSPRPNMSCNASTPCCPGLVCMNGNVPSVVGSCKVGTTTAGVHHVLLISIDGMHALDYSNCATGLSGVNGGQPFCPNLAGLAAHGVNYLDTSTSKPSDSFPGLMAIVTGGSPRTVGAFCRVASDPSLQPPAVATGNGLAAGSCTPGQTPTGTSTEYEEGIDIDQTLLNGGAPSGDGGANSIDPRRLPRD